ncbi:Cyclic nucleotide-gated cation channel beta-1, partial [Ophiophagus hannah]
MERREGGRRREEDGKEGGREGGRDGEEKEKERRKERWKEGKKEGKIEGKKEGNKKMERREGGRSREEDGKEGEREEGIFKKEERKRGKTESDWLKVTQLSRCLRPVLEANPEPPSKFWTAGLLQVGERHQASNRETVSSKPPVALPASGAHPCALASWSSHMQERRKPEEQLPGKRTRARELLFQFPVLPHMRTRTPVFGTRCRKGSPTLA